MVTASDFRAARLGRRFRGYARADVERVFDELALGLESATRERDALRARRESLEAELAERESLDRAMRETMLAAQREIEQIELDAQREAAAIRERARVSALERDAQLEDEHAVVAARLAEVRDIEESLRARSRAVVEEALRELSPEDAREPEPAPSVAAASSEDTQTLEMPVAAAVTAPAAAPTTDAPIEEPPIPAEDVPPATTVSEQAPMRTRRRSLVLSGAILTVGALIAVGIWQLSSANSASTASAGLDRSPAKTGQAMPATETAAATDSQSAVSATTTPAPGDSEPPPVAERSTVRLVISANRGDCWLQVRRGSSTGKLLYDGFLYQGAREDFRGSRLWVRFGNAGNVNVTLNGDPLAGIPAGTSDVLVTPAGIGRVSLG